MTPPTSTAGRRSDRGVQDTSGWGLLGLTIGILGGFAAAYYWVIPIFPRVKTTGVITAMTALVVAAMTIGGALGYLATRRPAPTRRD